MVIYIDIVYTYIYILRSNGVLLCETINFCLATQLEGAGAHVPYQNSTS